jgi:hypothetical protein
VNETINIIRRSLFDVSTFAIWIPFFAGLAGYRKAPVYIRLLVIHLFVAAIIQANGYYMWKNGQNNLFLLHQYTVEELVMLTLFYSYLLKPLLQQRVFISIIAVFCICAALNAIFLQPLKAHNTYTRSLESLIIMVWTILYFYLRLREDPETEVRHRPGLLLINAAFLLYFAASLLLFSLSNFLDEGKKETRLNLWAVHALASIIMYILIAVGLWKHRKTEI